MRWNERFLVVVDVDGRAGLRCDTCGLVLGPVDNETLSMATQAAHRHYREQHWTPRVGVLRRPPRDGRCVHCGRPIVATPAGHWMDPSALYTCPGSMRRHELAT